MSSEKRLLFSEKPAGIKVNVPLPHSLSPLEHVRMREVLLSVPLCVDGKPDWSDWSH